MIEPRERVEIDLGLLSCVGNALRTVLDWVAIAPHLGEEVVMTAGEVAVIVTLSPSRWGDLDELAAAHPCELLGALLKKKPPDRRV